MNYPKDLFNDDKEKIVKEIEFIEKLKVFTYINNFYQTLGTRTDFAIDNFRILKEQPPSLSENCEESIKKQRIMIQDTME